MKNKNDKIRELISKSIVEKFNYNKDAVEIYIQSTVDKSYIKQLMQDVIKEEPERIIETRCDNCGCSNINIRWTYKNEKERIMLQIAHPGFGLQFEDAKIYCANCKSEDIVGIRIDDYDNWYENKKDELIDLLKIDEYMDVVVDELLEDIDKEVDLLNHPFNVLIANLVQIISMKSIVERISFLFEENKGVMDDEKQV